MHENFRLTGVAQTRRPLGVAEGVEHRGWVGRVREQKQSPTGAGEV
ncbi:MAG: hypothetical protein WCT12_19840 [Verrucomicrobiota bacterium]